MSLLTCPSCDCMAFTGTTAFAVDGPPVLSLKPQDALDLDRRPVVQCSNCLRLFIIEQDGLTVINRGLRMARHPAEGETA